MFLNVSIDLVGVITTEGLVEVLPPLDFRRSRIGEAFLVPGPEGVDEIHVRRVVEANSIQVCRVQG